MLTWAQKGLMDPSSLLHQEMVLFHDHAMVLVVGVSAFVGCSLFVVLRSSFSTRKVVEAQVVETIWTIAPAVLLVWLALPSLRLLYLTDASSDEGVIMKVIGHQWYWSYELPLVGQEIDSYMVPTAELGVGDYRLLEVDNRTSLPWGVECGVVVTSSDVLHSWALPSAGVKMDAVPGRLNSGGITFTKPGVHYGQCSEICGANHSFMPIVVEAVGFEEWLGAES